MKHNPNSVPDILLERFRLGELDAVQTARIEKLLQQDPDLRRRLRDLETSDKEILARYRPEDMARRITNRLSEQPAGRSRGRLPLFGLATAAAGALAIAFFVLVAPSLRSGRPADLDNQVEVIRAKGDAISKAPSLSVFRRGPDGAERLADGATVFTRDTVQLRYEVTGIAYGVILSIDGRGTITPHFPLAPDRSTALERGSVLLRNSFELDDVPDFEKFFFVTADTEFDSSLVQAAARRLVRSGKEVRTTALDLPQGFDQTSFLLLKEKRK